MGGYSWNWRGLSHDEPTASEIGAAEFEQYANYAAFPATGATNTLYVAQDTDALYYWSGSAYVEITQSDPIIDGEVATYGDLPAAASHSGETYYVKTYSILYPTKLAGLYLSDGATWKRVPIEAAYILTDLTDGALLRSNGGREIVESFDNPVTAELINAASSQTNVDLDSSGWLVMQGAAAQNINFQDARNYPAVGWSFVAHNDATGTMYLANNAGVSQKDLAPGCTSIAILTDKSTANGTWVVKDIVPQDIRTTASPTFAGMNLGAGSLTVHSIKPDASDGLLIESNNGTDIGLLGAANTANVLWYGTHQFSLLTASQAVVTDASKNLTSLAYASANTASALVQRDASGNFIAGTITATAFTASGTVASAGLLRGTNNAVLIAARNAANSADISLSVNASDQFSSTGKFLISPAAASSGSTPYLHIVAASDTGLTASTEVPLLYVQSNAANRSWAAGAITNQRTVLINRSTYVTSGVSTWTNVAVLGISGYSSSNSGNLTITNSHAILISTIAISGTTNSYGITVNAATGATNNYAAQFIGGNTGFGTSAPTGIVHAASSTSANVGLFERSGQSANSMFISGRTMTTRSGTYGNSFGTLFAFSAQDAGAVINDIGYIGAYSTNSSQTTGNLEISAVSAGTRVIVGTFAYDKSTTLTGLLNANSTGVSGTSYIYGASTSSLAVSNSAQPYSNNSSDILATVGSPTTNNAGAAAQISPNYLTTRLNGWNFNARYGNDGNSRNNADLMISQYMANQPVSPYTAINAWESRIYCAYDRSISFSTTGSASNDIVFDSKGRLYGKSLHNNSTSPTGTTNQYIASGTYTPTLTNVANVAASTAYACQWIRVGNVVTVSGKFDIDPTLTATATQLGISFPLASNLTANNECAGTANASAIASMSAAILGDATNDRAEVNFVSTDITNQPMFFTFTYVIL